jgi:hypothetical protein
MSEAEWKRFFRSVDEVVSYVGAEDEICETVLVMAGACGAREAFVKFLGLPWEIAIRRSERWGPPG